MHHIEIQHFGPIQKISMDVNNFMIFIGPQASGKSTISKSIYFFKSIKNDFSEYFRNLTESGEESNLSELTKKIRRKFLNIWGSSFAFEKNVFIKYRYREDVYIEISKNINNGYINIKFSKKLMEKFNSITQEAIDFIKHNPKVKISGLNSYKEQKKYEDNKQIFLDNMEIYYSEIFDENKELFFIPASRSLLATLSEYLQNVKIDKLDFLMSDFLNRITYYKEIFSKKLITIIEEKINLEEKIDSQNGKIAIDIISKILKGDYISDRSGEKIYYNKKSFTRLNYASSGQQESIWILYLIFLYIIEKRSSFIVIEEPEAHLFPEAQKEIVDLISLLANLNNNQIIITTHSPYILASINNLIFADKIGKLHKEKVDKKISKKFWLDKNKVGVYFINDGECEDIMEYELDMIKIEIIDSISKKINEDYDFLFGLEE